jgi:hypothetical protein
MSKVYSSDELPGQVIHFLLTFAKQDWTLETLIPRTFLGIGPID